MVRITDILKDSEKKEDPIEDFEKSSNVNFPSHGFEKESVTKTYEPIISNSGIESSDILKEFEIDKNSTSNFDTEDPALTEEIFEEEKIKKLYLQARFAVMDVMDQAKSFGSVDMDQIDQVYKIADSMVYCVTRSRQLYRIAVYTRHMEEDFITHGVNVAIFSIMIGMGLNYTEKQLIDLCVVSMVHDVGMTSIPFNIIHSDRALTTEEIQMIKVHPKMGRDILKKVDEDKAWIPLVVSQEHERYNGKGYPLGLTGDNIHEYAQIIGLADDYEALTHDRKRRRRFLPYDAINIILEKKKGYFSRRLLKVLLNRISVFPLNAYVELNTGEVGMVVETINSKPLRPKVKLMYDSNKNKLDHGAEIELSKNPLLYITKSIYEEDIDDSENPPEGKSS